MTNNDKMMRRKALLPATVIAASLALAACSEKPAEAPKQSAIPVTAAQVAQSDIPLHLSAQGHIVPVTQVDIRPQVTSTIRSVDFKEGQQVAAGQLLFTLDAREDQTTVAHNQALIEKTRSDLTKAQQDLERNQALAKAGFLSPSAIDTSRNAVDSLKAELAAANSDLDTSHVKVSYSRIVAPFAGRAGSTSVHPGSLVQPGSTAPLVTLMQIDPIDAEFTLPEKDLQPVVAAQKNGVLPVQIRLPGGGKRNGKLIFIDNTVDPTSGTIRMKAEFDNKDHALWPGLYAQVELDAGALQGALSLPVDAILTGPEQRFVYLIKPDNSVASASVKLERVIGDTAVVTGLPAGAHVVREGGQNLRPGNKVKVQASGVKAAEDANS
ncbi:efflux RND transporter periplasmic adaptor subunit [Amantichitinum ursilacus]|uniref:Multidrug resistance protein MdtA n=1 Tax=Amantichitinum ursilacus TaxID=857265 RepID=A0A0N0GPP2_9NEIS|nr:efflux RND transporter periplasmic adaptor subunit [Amantichitinum ursilacus]KPC53921.1 Multidrug resistance protein MdtA precursor [Amantichitinum ursilacus]